VDAEPARGARTRRGTKGSRPAAILPVLALTAAGCRSTETPSTAAKSEGYAVHGSLYSRYVGRWTSGDHDNDLAEVLALELGDSKKDPVTGFVNAEGIADLDGKGSTSSPYYSLADTYDSAVTGKLYYAYADLHTVRSLETVRLGRQTIVDTPVVAYFDGLRAETAELGDPRLRLGAYGGAPVRLYASPSASASEGTMLGLFGETRPWTGGRLRADYMHIEDEDMFGPRRNDLVGLGASQSLGTSLRVEGQLTRLENDPRDYRARASYYSPDSDLVLQASWYRLVQTQGNLTTPLDPFYATLYDLFPYSQVGFLGSKSFGSHFDLQAGCDFRRVNDEGDIGTFNRDFNRYFATAGLKGVLPAMLDLSVTGEVWDATSSNISTYGADLSRKFDESVDAGIGTYYSLYKYDLYQNRELDDVRTWYLRVGWKKSSSTTFDLRYEFENDPGADYHSLRLGATWRF
jgi:hypothetical protein